jgi:hypothetical protein
MVSGLTEDHPQTSGRGRSFSSRAERERTKSMWSFRIDARTRKAVEHARRLEGMSRSEWLKVAIAHELAGAHSTPRRGTR